MYSNDFFEGAEKRIVICSDKLDFHTITASDIFQMLTVIGCTILDVISNDSSTMYLLSESSLLVTSTQLMLKTCGNTQPLKIIEHLRLDVNEMLVHFSHPKWLREELQPEPYNSNENELEYVKNVLNNVTLINKDIWKIYYNTNKSESKVDYFNEMICYDIIYNNILLDKQSDEQVTK